MNGIARVWNGSTGTYFRVLLGARVAELRKSIRRNDVGASAIELAIITAIIGVLAAALALVIQSVVAGKEAIISGL